MASSKRALPKVCTEKDQLLYKVTHLLCAAPSSVWGFAVTPLMCQYEVQLHVAWEQKYLPRGYECRHPEFVSSPLQF